MGQEKVADGQMIFIKLAIKNRMFRRLAEAFENNDRHTDYLQQQSNYFEALPNMIPSATSGLKGFDKVIQSADTTGNRLQKYAVPQPNSIFMPDTSPDLSRKMTQCSTASIDELLAMKNPNASMADIGCGWLYTPPVTGSYLPQLSKGFIGNEKGPLDTFNPPAYKKWFFDLEAAKKQILIDKCKALKNCSDVDGAAFDGVCGYCTDTNQGIPIDANGNPLYTDDSRTNCTATSIIRTSATCPGPVNNGGPSPIIDKTCDPVNGRLSAACLYNQVIAGGCSENGALAIALRGPSDNNDYVGSLRQSDAVKIYNRVANPPLNLDIFRQGQGTVAAVLQEVRPLLSNTLQASKTDIGAAARDLCIQQGAIKGYNGCNDLADGTAPPFDVLCLQQIFLKMGGQPNGSAYPSNKTIATYNTMGTLGAIKQQWGQLLSNMNSADYATQQSAMTQILGISPEKLIQRAPYKQGVEVFWFVPVPGNPQKVSGFLRRTIERDIVQLQPGPSTVKQIGGVGYGCMVQLTDVRATAEFAVRFNVTVDDGFWIAVNQPSSIDKTAMSQTSSDKPGLFENLGLQGPTPYQSNACTPFHASKPNIMKIFYEDAGGGWNAFLFRTIGCSGTPTLSPNYYSLTCEANAPFLTYEVGDKSNAFEELRNPGLFGQFLPVVGMDYHVKTDERSAVPGKKSFVRLNSANSIINFQNIAYQSWKKVTFAIRLYSMPVKETLIGLAFGNVGTFFYNIICTPINGSTAGLSIEYNIGNGVQKMQTGFQLSLTTWYLIQIDNKGSGFTLSCDTFSDIISRKGATSPSVAVNGNTPLYGMNATWSPTTGQAYQACNIMVGTKGYTGSWASMYGTSSFTYDLAWVHFFDTMIGTNDIFRECKADWSYTQFADSYDTYKTL